MVPKKSGFKGKLRREDEQGGGRRYVGGARDGQESSDMLTPGDWGGGGHAHTYTYIQIGVHFVYYSSNKHTYDLTLY
jgi:hypothetical protein